MILTIGAIKGGVGKTTLAINLAVARYLAGSDVLLIDGDPQHTAEDFGKLRNDKLDGKSGYTTIRLDGVAIRQEMPKLKGKYDDIIIDVGGRDNPGLRSALTVSDVVLVPCMPATFDTWSFDQMVALIGEAKSVNPGLRAVAFLNGADPDGQGSDNAETAEVIKEAGGAIELLPGGIVRRKAFRSSVAHGRSVLEVTPRDIKAVNELTTLVHALYPASDQHQKAV